MFTEIFLFELKYRLKRPATYIYMFIMALMGFMAMLAMGGTFGGGIVIGGGTGKVLANSPYQINWIVTVLSWFGVIITCSMMGTPIFRDFEHKSHSLYYTTPISKFGYLGGRFLGSLVITMLVFFGGAIGAWLGTYMPWNDADKIGPNMLMAYLNPYLLIVIPNLIFTGAIFFTLATLTRSALSIYVGGVLFLVLYGVASSLQGDLDNEFIANLLDPMGASAVYYTQRYWTTAEQNTQVLPLSYWLLINRAVWIGAGLLILAICFWRFSFSFSLSDIKLFRRKNPAEEAGAVVPPTRLSLPKVSQHFSTGVSWLQFRKLAKLEFKGIIKSIYFIAILIAGVVFLFVNGWQVGKMFGTSTYPVTPQVVQMLNGTFLLFVLIIITFYAGELVWRERDTRMNQIYDAMPMPNWVPFASKLTALMAVQVVLMAVVMVVGILLQTLKGYFNYEPHIYLKALFGFQLIDYWILCVLAMLVQVLVNNKYLGFFVMVVYYLLNIFKGSLGWEHNMYSYGSDPGNPYSAMNGYGHFVWPFTVYKIYWGAFALLLAMLSNLLWVRGSESLLKWRFKLASLQAGRQTMLATALGLGIFLVSGGFIFYNTNILNKYRNSKDQEKLQAQFEKEYKKYEALVQPRITAVNVQVDIFPKERDFRFAGQLWMKNKSSQPIDTLLVTMREKADVKKLELSRPASIVHQDKLGMIRFYRLQQPLQPGDSMQMSFDIDYITRGFENSRGNIQIVHNGTFVNSDYVPGIGYPDQFELQDDDDRKEHGLPPKERMAALTDTSAHRNSYISSNSDWVDFEATVSTSSDQIAIAPGYLQREWEKDGRRYFHYKMDAPILNFYSFLSARYELKKDKWVSPEGRDVAIEIYYQKGHEYNIDRMIEGVKASLDYFTANFSPYQHRQLRILEFPGYSSFAQSFPNTIPFSESIGFIAKVNEKDPDDNDYPFYVTAHEVAHQWWAHQVIGANVQGATVLSETMSQYAALMVMKKKYGPDRMKKFLRYEMNSYLMGRSTERKKELPLYKVENQQYIHYNKGSVVMYALQDYIGEQNLNRALASYIKATAFQQPPYTTTLEFMTYIRQATPDSLQYLVTDMFEKITLYENKAEEATYQKLPDGTYKVRFTVDTKKFYADSTGTEQPTPMNDYVEIGVMGRKKVDGHWQDHALYLEKKKLKTGKATFEVIVKDKPEKAGIDPMNKLIDRNPDDNVKKVEEGKVV